jgi:Domain of unknown function (DUF4499)
MARAKRPGAVRPHWLWFLVLDGGIWALIQFVINPGLYERVRSRSGDRLPPQRAIQGLLAGTVVIHAGEAMVASRMATRRGLPARPWALQTFVVGFPSLLALRRQGD